MRHNPERQFCGDASPEQRVDARLESCPCEKNKYGSGVLSGSHLGISARTSRELIHAYGHVPEMPNASEVP